MLKTIFYNKTSYVTNSFSYNEVFFYDISMYLGAFKGEKWLFNSKCKFLNFGGKLRCIVVNNILEIWERKKEPWSESTKYRLDYYILRSSVSVSKTWLWENALISFRPAFLRAWKCSPISPMQFHTEFDKKKSKKLFTQHSKHHKNSKNVIINK